MIPEFLKIKTKAQLRTKLILAAILIVIFTVVSLTLDFKFQLIQYEEIGTQFKSILWTNATASVIAMALSFVFIFLCIFITNIIIHKKIKHFFIEENIQPVRLPNCSLAFIIAIIGAVATKDFLYKNALVFLKANMFYAIDPVFGRDFGYYLFQRPFIVALSDYISGAWLIVTIYAIAYYVLAFGIIFNAVAIESVKKYGVFAHNLINIGIFFLIQAFTYRIDAEKVLYSKNGNIIGAGFTDVYIWLNVYKIAPFVLAAVVILSFIFTMRNKYRKALITVSMVPAFWALGFIVAVLVQLIFVVPNELTKEKYYIKKHIELTRYAYNLSEKLNEREFYVSDVLDPTLLKDNNDLTSNLKINDYSPNLEANQHLQSLRKYYKFVDADVVKYNINGKPTVLYSAARELDKKKLDEKVYVNMKFRYTHGYGITMSPVSKLNKEGQPEFLVKNIPIESEPGMPTISVPQIYFGEMTKDHVVVKGKNINEIDYPEKESNKETIYSGKAGIRLTPFNRVLMSIKLGDPRLIMSQYIDSDSKVLINRDIIERAKLITPFLDIDEDPYIVVDSKGRMKWIIDGYTESSYFPYSLQTTLEHNRKINYIRNSVKIVVDAYDGTMKFYIVDRLDPIIKTYESIYPDIFEDGPMPDDIAQYNKYPERILKIQADILEKYHMTDETTFFNNEDKWSVATHLNKGKQLKMDPDYILMRAPESQSDELMLMIPFTPDNRNNLSGWLVARSDIYNYGKLMLYKIPKNSLVYGPMLIESNIDQDPEIIKSMAVWGEGGASITRGNLMPVPLENNDSSTLIYVQPVYISDPKSTSPSQVKKVIVSHQGRIVMEDDVETAIQKLSTLAPSNDTANDQPISKSALVYKLVKVYEEIKAYAAANDWEGYGKKMRELDTLMAEINKRKEEFK